LNATTNWKSFPLDGIIVTRATGLPDGFCPLSGGRVCTTNRCNKLITEAEGYRFRLDGISLLFEVNTAIAHNPAQIVFIEVSSYTATPLVVEVSVEVGGCLD